MRRRFLLGAFAGDGIPFAVAISVVDPDDRGREPGCPWIGDGPAGEAARVAAQDTGLFSSSGEAGDVVAA